MAKQENKKGKGK